MPHLAIETYVSQYFWFMLILVLLVAVIVSAITLCLYHEEGIKRKDLFAQVAIENSKIFENSKKNKNFICKK